MRSRVASQIATGLTSAARPQSLCVRCVRLQRQFPRNTQASFSSSSIVRDNASPASAPPANTHQRTSSFQPRTSSSSPAASASPASAASSASAQPARQSLTDGLNDPPPTLAEDERQVDWTRSFHGLSSEAFSPEAAAVLTAELSFDDIEVKPDGIVYLPEIKYRRILNKAFGPGGWGLAPRGETIVTGKVVTREYGLVASGRLVSIARGEQQYFDPDGIPTATEGCKSNALMRCCKDLGVASELWDPRFIKRFLAKMAKETMVEHVVTKKRRKHWMRKEDDIKYPFKEVPQGRF